MAPGYSMRSLRGMPTCKTLLKQLSIPKMTQAMADPFMRGGASTLGQPVRTISNPETGCSTNSTPTHARCPRLPIHTVLICTAPEVSIVTLAGSAPPFSAMLLAQPVKLLQVGSRQVDEQIGAIRRRRTQVGLPSARTQVAHRLQHVIAQSRRPTQDHVRPDHRNAQLWWGCDDAYHAVGRSE